MFNSTSVHRTNNNMSVNAEADKHVEIAKTKEKGQIIACNINSERFKYLTRAGGAYLDDKIKVELGETFQILKLGSDGHTRSEKTYLIHGVSVEQIKTNGELALVEIVDREAEPLLLSDRFIDARSERDAEEYIIIKE